MSGEGKREVDFSGLVAGLAASAVAVLAQVDGLMSDPADEPGKDEEREEQEPEEKGQRISEGLAGARQLIDTLAVLEEKTQGNLNADEEELLRSALSELRIRFVGLSSRSRSGQREEGEAG